MPESRLLLPLENTQLRCRLGNRHTLSINQIGLYCHLAIRTGDNLCLGRYGANASGFELYG